MSVAMGSWWLEGNVPFGSRVATLLCGRLMALLTACTYTQERESK